MAADTDFRVRSLRLARKGTAGAYDVVELRGRTRAEVEALLPHALRLLKPGGVLVVPEGAMPAPVPGVRFEREGRAQCRVAAAGVPPSERPVLLVPDGAPSPGGDVIVVMAGADGPAALALQLTDDQAAVHFVLPGTDVNLLETILELAQATHAGLVVWSGAPGGAAVRLGVPVLVV